MNTLSPSLRIGVLRGGPSPEYDVSLKTGDTILRHLAETHRPVDIFISRDGIWHMHGLPRTPERILKHVDVVWNGLHGTYGEDGKVQEILDHHGVRYTGSARLPSALAMNKYMAKDRLRTIGVKTPLSVVVRRDDDISDRVREVFNSLPHPLVVKPSVSGSSLGLYLAQTPSDLTAALDTLLSVYPSALVEEYISGREATCAVVDDLRGQETYVLPVVEIIRPPERVFFDYHAKYGGESREICPANFQTEDKKEIERFSSLAHRALGLSHYSRSDFIVSPRRGIYFLEVNSLPAIAEPSLFTRAIQSVGISIKEFIHHILSLALNEK